VNEDPKDALLREYQEEITRLKQALDQRKSKGSEGKKKKKKKRGSASE
jgi:kinesin family protein 3/17